MPTLQRIRRPVSPRPATSQSRGGNQQTQFYRQARWLRLRASILDEEPLCRSCKQQDRLEPATMVDHIIPVKQGGEPYERDNLQPLCEGCHARKSARDKWRKLTRNAS